MSHEQLKASHHVRSVNGPAWRMWLLLLFLGVFPFGVAADPPRQKPPHIDKLIGHWKLAGDVQDSSGHALHGENQAVTFESDKTGPLPTQAKFNGRDQFLSVPHSEHLNLGTDDFTISFWVHTDELLDDDIGDLVTKFDPETRVGFNFSLRNNTGVTSNLPNSRQLQFGIDSGTEPTWKDLGRPGGEASILPFSMAEYRSRLYAGTCEPAKDGKGNVYQLNGSQWIQMSVPHLANSVSSLVVFNDDLYCGTAKYRVAGSALAESENLNLGGEIFRFNPVKQTWIPCGRLPNVEAIGGMTVYKGRLYASSLYKPPGFFRYEGGDKWTSLPTPNDKRTESLSVFNGYLWATGYDQGNIYRFDGETWTDMGQLGDNTQTYSFAIHQGRMCVGTWPSGRVFRLAEGDKWEDMGRLGQEMEVMGMLVHNGKLYAGTLPLAEIHRYEGGQSWTRLKQLDTTENVKYRRVWTMAQHRGQLVSSVLPSGRVHSMDVGQYVTSWNPVRPGWRHLAAMRRSSALEIYVDGVPVANEISPSQRKPWTALNITNSRPLLIGSGAGDNFHGRMSNLKIYRRALGIDEIAYLAKERLARLPVKQIIAHRGASASRPENTFTAFLEAERQKATCVEVDVRRTKDNVLVAFHDATIDRTTNGKGGICELTWDQIKDLDAGSWKHPQFSTVTPTRIDHVLKYFNRSRPRRALIDEVDVLLDLKEDGPEFMQQVIKAIKIHGDARRIIVGVRTVEQAQEFRKSLPDIRQLGLINAPEEIEAFAQAKVETIRLWPKWLTDETLVPRVKQAGVKLHLNGSTGLPDEIEPLLKYQPDSLSTDNPEQLIETLLRLDQSPVDQ